jgi:amino acid transporter
MPLELVAASITLQYWGNPLKHHDIWVTIFLILIVLLNIFGVKLFADAEVVLSLMKVIAIVGFM